MYLHTLFLCLNYIIMLDKYYFEFSKIYGRLMRLEMQMKKMLISSVLAYYKDDVIKVFEKFFL